MKTIQPVDLSKFTPLDRKTLYAKIVFWVFLIILSLEIIILSTIYYLYYSATPHALWEQAAVLITIGCVISTVVTIAIIAILHWYILLHIDSNHYRSEETHQVLLDLFRAMENDEMEMYYQPQINLKTMEIIGMEALVRWIHPTRGIILPADFIPLAEQSGLIITLGQWTLEEACRQNKYWLDHGISLKLAVNLSPLQFKSDIVHTVRDVLDSTQLPAENLELEITETTFIHNIDDAIQVMHQLQRMGICVSMDDFGTGYSSLANLDRFPIQKLKIDKAFVHKISPYDEEPNLADSIIKMGHSLKLKILAEGVETEYQKNYFQALGCDEAQGYFFGEPMPANKFYKFVKKKYQKQAKD